MLNYVFMLVFVTVWRCLPIIFKCDPVVIIEDTDCAVASRLSTLSPRLVVQ